MKNIFIFYILLSLIMSGCNRLTKKTNDVIEEVSIEQITTTNSEDNTNNYRDTILLESSLDKKIFKVLSMLPDASLGGEFDWPKKDRESIYHDALNNIMINESEYFLVKKLVSSNQLKVGVVDGSWELLVYNTQKDYDIILTHPKTGDGDRFFTYKFDGKNFSKINQFFPENYINYFFKSSKPDNCRIEADDEFELMLDYYLFKDTVEVYNYYAKNDSSCFLGNILVLIFNDKTEKLEYNDIYWTDKKY